MMDLKYYINIHLGITQEEAARQTGFSLKQINRACNGHPAGLRLRRKLTEWSNGQIDVAKLAMIDPQEKGK
jgi:hypothetical protein